MASGDRLGDRRDNAHGPGEAALSMAVTMGGELPEQGIFHADRGTQYTSGQVARFARRHGLAQSGGRTGVYWDKSQAGSFWATSKVEFYSRFL